MTRLFALLLLLTAAGPATAGVVVVRVVLPPDLLPTADEPTDPAALADRIAKTTKAVGDKLAEADTGTATRKEQEQIRRDIDALIKALENQPPMGGGGGSGSPPPPMGGQGGGSGQQPNPPQGQGGGSRPRGGNQSPPTGGQQPMGGQSPQPGQPMGGATPGTPGTGSPPPGMPLAETIAKDFWGHLPEQPRQRMMQFFREQYMSRYKDLLPKYYQSLAEKEKKGKK